MTIKLDNPRNKHHRLGHVCVKGHMIDGENAYTANKKKPHYVICRICKAEYTKKYRDQNKAREALIDQEYAAALDRE